MQTPSRSRNKASHSRSKDWHHKNVSPSARSLCGHILPRVRLQPFEIETELRIYQNDEVQIYDADPDSIMHIMETIVSFDRRITELRMEAAE